MIKLPEPAVHGLHAYTESQMRQAIRDALEEAAKVCDQRKDETGAERIRKLQESV